MRTDFERALVYIQDIESELLLSRLYGLSDLEEEERTRFEEVWERVPTQRRRQVLQALIEIAETSFLVDFGPIFRFCLGDEDARVRALAINGLWEDNDWRLASLLIRLLREDPAAEVRAAAASALGRFVLAGELEDWAQARAAKICETLLKVFESGQEPLEVRRRALESLAYASNERVPTLIEAAYWDDEPKMRVSALFAMGRSADPRWASIVLQELHNDDPEMRYEAARACGELQLVQAVPMLEKLTQDPDREVQETAIWALGQIGGREARCILEACYEWGDEFICEAVDDALAILGLGEASFNLAYHELLSDELNSLEDLESWE